MSLVTNYDRTDDEESDESPTQNSPEHKKRPGSYSSLFNSKIYKLQDESEDSQEPVINLEKKSFNLLKMLPKPSNIIEESSDKNFKGQNQTISEFSGNRQDSEEFSSNLITVNSAADIKFSSLDLKLLDPEERQALLEFEQKENNLPKIGPEKPNYLKKTSESAVEINKYSPEHIKNEKNTYENIHNPNYYEGNTYYPDQRHHTREEINMNKHFGTKSDIFEVSASELATQYTDVNKGPIPSSAFGKKVNVSKVSRSKHHISYLLAIAPEQERLNMERRKQQIARRTE